MSSEVLFQALVKVWVVLGGSVAGGGVVVGVGVG